MTVDKLLKLKKTELSALYKKHKIAKSNNMLSDVFLATKSKLKKKIFGAGELEVLPDGYGFLRNTTVEKDVYISSAQIKKSALRGGDYVTCELRPPLGNERNFGALEIVLVNESSIEKSQNRKNFDNMLPYYPNKKIDLGSNISCRLIDIVAPIGRGQRSLIVAPPKAGKTSLMIDLANGIIENNKDLDVWLLLVDERPEEVTEIKSNVSKAKVFSSTFDEDPQNHIKVAERVLSLAKRGVEAGKNIVILMDNITRLARAYNLIIPNSGKTISGGLDPHAITSPKKFFGAARNMKEDGSLTILATALVDTGSKMDDVIYEEFKGTGNSEIHLSREIAQQRIFPAINIVASGTRKEELLIDKSKLEAIYKLRQMFAKFNDIESLKFLLSKLKEESDSNVMLYKILKNR